MEGVQLGSALSEHRFVVDRVAPVNRLGQVSDHRHRGRARHASALEVPHGGPPQIVRETTRESGVPAGGHPGPPERLDWFPLAVEQPRDNLACRLLHLPGSLKLALKNLPQARREREDTTFLILRLARFEPKPARLQVEMAFLPGQDFRFHAPAGDVGDLEYGLEVVGKVGEHPLELVGLEEPRAHIVFVEHLDVGADEDLSGALSETEHQLVSFPSW